jgi:tRNA-dihydrouridine synthase C|tara:strand:- start:1113 stop:2048 length:936 start_codon:yes stop_codon:yes gene_type:complete
MRIVLAPMDGVLDHMMRNILTDIGDYDLCVTEFIRIVDQLLPDKVFHRNCPELKSEGKTRSGTPVRVQLLGQDPDYMAVNALRAIELGSQGIDLNFGCPSPTVNKSKGGAVLLKEPETIYKIIKSVRDAVPNENIVSAKIRLGYEDKSLALDVAHAVESAGANQLTVHARTKLEGYKPPAHWDWIGKIKEKINIPVIANGEIWTLDDYNKCKALSNCSDVMVGRGALAIPNLSHVLKLNAKPLNWKDINDLLLKYAKQEVYGDKNKYYPNRIKQWLRYLKIQYSEADELFSSIRTLKTSKEIIDIIKEGSK